MPAKVITCNMCEDLGFLKTTCRVREIAAIDLPCPACNPRGFRKGGSVVMAQRNNENSEEFTERRGRRNDRDGYSIFDGV